VQAVQLSLICPGLGDKAHEKMQNGARGAGLEASASGFAPGGEPSTARTPPTTPPPISPGRRNVHSPTSVTRKPILSPSSFSTYLSERPYVPPTRPAPTLNHFSHTTPLPAAGTSESADAGDATGAGAGAAAAAAEDNRLALSSPGSSRTVSAPESHYDRWVPHWNKQVIALNTGMRRPPVLPISEKARELIELEHERRKAEADAMMIRNRVLALREQERRVLIRTTQAEQRLQQLLRIKAMKDSKKGFRDEMKAIYAMQRYQEAQAKRQQERERLENYRQYRQQMQELKAKRAHQAQLERKEMEMRRKQVVAAQQSARAEQFKLVRGFETLARHRIQQEELMRKAEIERQRAARLAAEEARRAAALEAAQKLIQEEEELLRRLQVRREQHNQAYERLAVELQPSLTGRGTGAKHVDEFPMPPYSG